MTPSRKRTSLTVTVPAPVGGWNARDPLAAMPSTDAVILDNIFPDTGVCRVRQGQENYITGIGLVRTLAEWSGPSTHKLIAAASNTFYDVSVQGTASAMSPTMSTCAWQSSMFGTPAGSYLYFVNGEDTPYYYDGAVFATSSLTGSGLPTSGNALKYVVPHQQRLFFGEGNSLNLWYLAPNSLFGTLTKFPLGSLARKGGVLKGIGSWTIDGGRGMDDHFIAVTSEGEVFVYQGTDPGTASTWSLVGVYSIGRPIGDRCLVKIAGDLIVICEDGFYPLSKALLSAEISPNIAISDKISGAVREASAMNRDSFGWEAILHPRGRFLSFNVPVTPLEDSVQFVMNTVTGAWARFTGQPAFSWSLYNGDLYYGGRDGVYRSDVGTNDFGANIEADMLCAYNYFNSPGTQKLFKLVRPIFISDGQINPALVMCTDFKRLIPTSTPSYEPGGGTAWDEGFWDETDWAGGYLVFARWQNIGGIGFCGGLRVQFVTKDYGAQIAAIDYLFEPGGVL